MSRRVSIGSRTKSVWTRTFYDKLLDGLGRNVIVYLEDLETDCPNCYYDSFHKASTNKYFPGGPKPFTRGRCPVCNGKGKLLQERTKCIKAIVNWSDPENNTVDFIEAGSVSDSVVRLKTDRKFYNLLNTCKYVLIDDIKCFLVKPLILRSLGSTDVLIAYFKTEKKYGK